MFETPLVTVIIPSFNAANTLNEAIQSIEVPVGVDAEIIVVDDGSSDNTAEVLAPLVQKGQVRYFYKENGGAASARNFGLKVAKGQYIGFLDADDVMLPGSLKKRLEIFDRFPELDIVFGDYILIDDMGEALNKQPILESKGFLSDADKYITYKENEVVLFSSFFHHFYLRATPRPICTDTIMISRDIVLRRGYFNKEYSIGEDNDYWQRLIEGNPVGYVNAPVAAYFHYRSNLTRNILRYMDDEIKYNKTLHDSNANQFREYLKNIIFIRKKIALCHFEKGYFFYKNRQFSEARRTLIKSFICWPIHLKTYKVLLLSFIRVGSSS